MDLASGLIHFHGIDKHTTRATFNTNQRVVDDFHHSGFDHAGVHELAYREDEFRNADDPVFYDTDNDDDERWGGDQLDDLECPSPRFSAPRTPRTVRNVNNLG